MLVINTIDRIYLPGLSERIGPVSDREKEDQHMDAGASFTASRRMRVCLDMGILGIPGIPPILQL